MIVITENEILEYTKDMFTDDEKIIQGKHNVFKGEKDFALGMIEQTLGLLRRNIINDEFVIQYLQGLISLCKDEQHHYEQFLKVFAPSDAAIKSGKQGEVLSEQDKRILEEMMVSNLGEYMCKGDYQSCCYSAMDAFLVATYSIILKNIKFNVGTIDMIADLDDELQNINIYEAKNDDSPVFVQWHSTNKINNIYMLYKTQYVGLDNSTLLDLVAADVIEEDYYFKDERFTIAPSILVKQYCAIIEHEINEVILLLKYDDKPDRHLMWNNMKKYVNEHGIDLESTAFELTDLLEDLHSLRNKAAHGEIITKEEYEKIVVYKSQGLFNALSATKLSIRGIKVSPSIEEIKKYMGYEE